MARRLVNLTPYTINIVTDDGAPIMSIPPTGQVARIPTKIENLGEVEIDGKMIPVTKTVYGEMEGLPDPVPGVTYIVSVFIANHVPERGDVFVPGEQVRNDSGKVVGCRSLSHV